MAQATEIGYEPEDAYTIRPAESRNAKPDNWAKRKNSPQIKSAEKSWPLIQQAYTNMQEFGSRSKDYWNIYNCQLDENQAYTGYAQCYIPIARDCVEARKRRTLAHLFPINDRHVEAISTDDETPYATQSLLEHHISLCDLRTKIGAMIVQGDVTGQWNLYVDWAKDRKRVTRMVERTAQLGEEGTVDPGETFQDISDDEFVTEEHPDIWVPATTDIAVIPPTVDELKDAQIVCILHRMSKSKVADFIKRGIFVSVTADELMRGMEVKPSNMGKKALEDLGIKTEGTDKHAVIYEAHLRIRLDHEDKEQSVIWYRGDGKVLGIIRNPFWGKRIPIISAPLNKTAGAFFGKSQIEPVRFLQWQANDIANIGQDAAMYALNPVIMTDPEKNPQYQSMVLSMAAVWPIDPNSTRILEFPKMYQDSWQIVGILKAQIRESMNVNDYEIGHMPQTRKTNAQVGALGQAAAMGSNDMAKDIENRILNPLLEMMFELDTQFRTEETTILVMGEFGVKAHAERVSPQQFSAKYFFRWLGTDYIASVQRIQQQIAAMNVLRGIPPQAMNGKRLDIMPILEQMVETVFGSGLAGKIIIDQRDQVTVPPDMENEMLHNGLAVLVHPMDNDIEHIRAHQELAKTTGDPSAHIRVHLLEHMKQLQGKAAQQQAQMAGGASAPGQGMPGGAGPGVPGSPRIGAQPAMPRGGQGPGGMIHQDQIQSPESGGRG